MRKELIKIRNKLFVYSLIISTSVIVGSCVNNQCAEEKENVKIEEEASFSKIKEKRIEYGK